MAAKKKSAKRKRTKGSIAPEDSQDAPIPYVPYPVLRYSGKKKAAKKKK